MADHDERQSLLGEEEDDASSALKSPTGPGRPMPAICDPNHLLHRVVVLVFMCFLGFGSYFCYDNPASLQTQVIKDLNLNTASFMQLYAWYSWPNVILCFLGGFLIDRVFGIRMGTIIFSLFVCAGQVIFATGALVNRFWLCEAGRFVFGVGGESLAVAQNTYAVNWFKGKELNLVFGLQLSMARLGSTVNMNIMGWVYSKMSDLVGSPGHTALGASLMLVSSDTKPAETREKLYRELKVLLAATAAVTCLFSLICALVLAFLDKRAERILHKEEGKTGERIKLTDVKDFSLSLWLIFIVCVGYYVAIFPFIGLGQVFFIEKFNFSSAEARAVNSIVYIISAPASPLLGFMVDKTGRNVIWVMIAVVATLGAHMMLAFTFWNPWIAMSLLGISYSLLACALWPMVAFVVPDHQLATAYGFMQSIQNLGLALIALAAGAILDTRGYLILQVFFCICICIALMAVVALYFVDFLKGGDLNRSAAARARLQKEAASQEEFKKRPRRQTESDSSKLTPMCAFRLRNRYLSRLGAQLPDHCSAHLSSLAYRSVLK